MASGELDLAAANLILDVMLGALRPVAVRMDTPEQVYATLLRSLEQGELAAVACPEAAPGFDRVTLTRALAAASLTRQLTTKGR